ncbi:hypothetical protein DFH07DRAFT_956747 [Mycena maculata]|uniref:F-box domain-containing protein n=1 Tax=Mycena maculata TaxID=230809 RepID=A0AAD7NIR7_9AGAR|nr:hypothetical protein DFH07DRAFT_956747 [Mycena maculata]
MTPDRQSRLLLLEVPVDCVTEILLYLVPEDVLRLSRLCKALRSFLTQKDSRHIWKQAFANLNGPTLPPCPPNLTEVQYAHLVFSNDCHGCGKRPDLPVDWDLRVHYCSECELTNTIKFDASQPPSLTCDPSADIRKLIAIPFNPAFLNADLTAVTAVYEALNAHDRLAYRDNRHRMLVDTRIHARECRAWEARLVELARAAFNKASPNIKQAINTKLSALGWAEEIDIRGDESHYESADECVLVLNAREEWAEMKPGMERLMASRRKELAAQAAAELLFLSSRYLGFF